MTEITILASRIGCWQQEKYRISQTYPWTSILSKHFLLTFVLTTFNQILLLNVHEHHSRLWPCPYNRPLSLNRRMLKLAFDGQVSFSEAILLLPEQLHAVRLACSRAKCTQAFVSPRRENRRGGARPGAQGPFMLFLYTCPSVSPTLTPPVTPNLSLLPSLASPTGQQATM